MRTDEIYKIGDVIGGKFEVHHRLGEGGFGIVYLVYDRSNGAVIALKTFRHKFLGDAEVRRMFKKEALLWVNLGEHPFILPALFVEELSGQLFVAMDFIAPDEQGRVSLEDHLLHSRGPLDTNRNLKWAIQFCYGMEYANAHGVKVHRDIKPSNILISRDGVLQITDFGLAVAAASAWRGGQSLVSRGNEGRFGLSLLEREGKGVCGTPGYIAPELYRGEGADARSDIYSFGVVLWQMVTGSPTSPFNPHYDGDFKKYLKEIYELQMSGQIPRLESPYCPVIERCLAIEPSQRYGSFRQLRGELEPIFQKLTGRVVIIPPPKGQGVDFWNNKGVSLYHLGRYEEAIGCCDEALQIDQRHAAAWSNKSNSLRSLGRYEEAIRCCDKALEINQRLAHAWNNKGISLHHLGRYEEAIGCFDEALRTDQLHVAAWNSKGNSLRSLGRYEEAIRCYCQALEIDPRNTYIWSNKGLSLDSLGRYEEAIRCYDKALEIDPRNTNIWINKGTSLDSLGRYEEAIRCYDKALEIDPRNATAWNNKGLSFDSLGRYEETIRCYDKALQIDRRYAHAWCNKGASLALHGRYDEAIRCFDKALQMDSRYMRAWEAKGLCLDSLDRYEEAIVCYDKALEINPRRDGTWFNKALAEDDLGQFRNAKKSYRRFIGLAPAESAKQLAHARQRLRELQ